MTKLINHIQSIGLKKQMTYTGWGKFPLLISEIRYWFISILHGRTHFIQCWSSILPVRICLIKQASRIVYVVWCKRTGYYGHTMSWSIWVIGRGSPSVDTPSERRNNTRGFAFVALKTAPSSFTALHIRIQPNMTRDGLMGSRSLLILSCKEDHVCGDAISQNDSSLSWLSNVLTSFTGLGLGCFTMRGCGSLYSN